MSLNLSDHRRLAFRRPKPLLKGLDARVNRWIGSYERRGSVLTRLRRVAEEVDRHEDRCRQLGDHDLAREVLGFREQFRRQGAAAADTLLVPALAAIREMADRKTGLRPYPVQIMGAVALHDGLLAEMATGEGKTLTAGLAATLAGWTGQPVHIITVNDYLVERDARWLTPLYHACGLRVGHVAAPMDPEARRHGYGCDLTYVTSKEVLADFLRDRIRLGEVFHPTRRLIRQLWSPQGRRHEGLVLRGLHTAIVDEADSVLIDEAVTPLIISTPRQNDALREACLVANRLTEDWARDVDYRTNLRYREVELTPEGLRKLEGRCASLPGLWQGPSRRLELVKQALVAREFFLEGKQYVLDHDRLVIVDEFTGRPMPQRTWHEGLHQAIEAKAGLPLSDPSETIARLSFQRFFRCYQALSGMTGTAREAAAEFWQVYGLAVVAIPTNRPCIRQHGPDRVFAREETKWQAVAEEVERLHRTNRPILVGTRSVAASEQLAQRLTQRRLDFRLLNATRLAEEAAIIASAGEQGRITIATNMAGRGTDIRLGDGVAKLGGLHVLATERHEARRIDRQLFGRSARQGDPGSAQAFVSAEDELLRKHVPKAARQTLEQALVHHVPASKLGAGLLIRRAQHRAQRLAFRQRAAVLRMDTWLEESLAFSGVEADATGVGE